MGLGVLGLGSSGRGVQGLGASDIGLPRTSRRNLNLPRLWSNYLYKSGIGCHIDLNMRLVIFWALTVQEPFL